MAVTEHSAPDLEPDDDPEIPDDAIVWRRLDWNQTANDEESPGFRRLSSGGFTDSSDGSGLSVHLAQPGESIEEWLRQQHRESDGLAMLSVREIRLAGFGVVKRPETSDPHHCEITGRFGTRGKKKALHRIAKQNGLLRQPREPTPHEDTPERAD